MLRRSKAAHSIVGSRPCSREGTKNIRPRAQPSAPRSEPALPLTTECHTHRADATLHVRAALTVRLVLRLGRWVVPPILASCHRLLCADKIHSSSIIISGLTLND